MATTMNSNQIVSKLQNDWSFGVNFIIDNNPNGVQSNLTSLGVDLPDNPTKATLRSVINQLIEEGRGSAIVESLSVPYINESPNYTGGFKDTFRQFREQQIADSPTPVAPQSRSVGIVIAQVFGNIASGVLGVVSTDKQIELENERQETLESQLQLQQKNQVLGLPQNVFYGILALIGLIVVIVAMRK